MSKRIMKKLRDHSGETIAETLIALLVSALALVMLAGAIGTAARVVTTSERTMQAYYLANNNLATPGDSGGTKKPCFRRQTGGRVCEVGCGRLLKP